MRSLDDHEHFMVTEFVQPVIGPTEMTHDRDLVSIFVLPPSIPDLELRLRTRAQDSDEVIHARMGKAADEMSHWAEYDYVVINTDIDRAFAQVRSILAAERLKRERQTGLSDFVRRLQAEL